MEALRDSFGAETDEELQAILDRIAADLKRNLSDIGEFKTVCEPSLDGKSVWLEAKGKAKGQTFGHVIDAIPGVDYTPCFRGWWQEVIDSLAVADNTGDAA